MYNGEDIKRRQLELKNNLLKGFGVGIDEVDENGFEKAHKQGDLHPNGKWYWESSAAGGKGDWRTIGGRRHKASQVNVSTEEKKDSTKKKDSESDLTKLNDILSKLKNGDTSVKKMLDTKEKAFLKKLGFELDERIGRGLLAVKSKESWKLANEIESYMSKNGDSSKKKQETTETQKEDLRAAREKLSYLQDNEERLIKRDGKEKYDKRLKQAKEEVSKLKGNKEPERKFMM